MAYLNTSNILTSNPRGELKRDGQVSLHRETDVVESGNTRNPSLAWEDIRNSIVQPTQHQPSRRRLVRPLWQEWSIHMLLTMGLEDLL
jgi:hypothetical protein